MQPSDLSFHALLRIIATSSDAVPFPLIEEAVRRGESMEAEMIAILDDEISWTADPDEPRYWLPLHAIMVLGLFESERAGLALARALRTVADSGFELADWLDGNWPALLRNKPDSVLPEFRTLLDDSTVDAGYRAMSAAVLLAAAQRQGPQPLDDMLDVIAAKAADEREELELRQLLAADLLAMPRERHRAVLQSLADVRSEMGVMYLSADVDAAFDAMVDEPEWDRFFNPWSFYSEDAIAERAARWAEEAIETDGLYLEPYVREFPKVGRNDPCPCGSGRKYKKCCLRAE